MVQDTFFFLEKPREAQKTRKLNMTSEKKGTLYKFRDSDSYLERL